jgi:hypothetical protein
VHNPCNSDLSHAHSPLLCDLFHRLKYRRRPSTNFVLLDEIVRFASFGGLCKWPRKEATCNRSPRDRGDAKMLGGRIRKYIMCKVQTVAHLKGRHHFPFFFAVKEVVVVLHRDEGC